MPFDFSTLLRERLFWTFPEISGKCPLVRHQLSLPYIRVQTQQRNVEWAVPTGTAGTASNSWSWREVCSAKPRGLWEWWTWAKCPVQMPTERQRSSSPNDAPRENRDTWNVWLQHVCCPLCLISHGGCSLFFRWRACGNQLPNMPYTSMPSNYSL